MAWATKLSDFILQSNTIELKTSNYPKEWAELKMKVSFGMGIPAKVSWIAFLTDKIEVSYGIYPAYLYYKKLNKLILAYGISENNDSLKLWPIKIQNSAITIENYFNKSVPRYGNSFVFKAYNIKIKNNNVIYLNDNQIRLTDKDIESDLNTIISYYKKIDK